MATYLLPDPFLLEPVDPGTAAVIADFYRRRGPRHGGWGDAIAEVLCFGGLVDVPLTCARLCARLATCLAEGPAGGAPPETVGQLHARLCRFLPYSDEEAHGCARHLLAAALGLVHADAEQLQDASADSDWASGAVAALHVMVDYVTGCFAVTGLHGGHLIAEVAAA